MNSKEEKPAGFVIPKLNDCEYTPFYCEENIWQLAKYTLDTNKTTSGLKCYVVVMSNPNQKVHLWKQNLSYIKNNYDFDLSDNSGFVIWDYHVFFITEYQDQTLVFDYNSTLSFPVDFSQYASESVKHDLGISRYFKVIEADQYVKNFSSDRSHMRLSNGNWLKPPPSYDPILNKDRKSNFTTLIDMESVFDDFGDVLILDDFVARFTRPNE